MVNRKDQPMPWIDVILPNAVFWVLVNAVVLMGYYGYRLIRWLIARWGG